MKDVIVYRKTAKGAEEVLERTYGLEKHLRRVLIMVDGIKGLEELSAFARSNELDHTIDQLVKQGYIEKLDVGERTGSRIAFAPAANDPGVFALIKRSAMVDIRKRLGPVSSLLIEEIEACKGPLELRQKLRNIENALVHVLGPVEGAELARKIGSELTRLVPLKDE